jgi:hypothetical protein
MGSLLQIIQTTTSVIFCAGNGFISFNENDIGMTIQLAVQSRDMPIQPISDFVDQSHTKSILPL